MPPVIWVLRDWPLNLDLCAPSPVVGGAHGFDQMRPDTEAMQLLDQLRKDKAGVLRWLVEGAVEAESFMQRVKKSP